MSNTRSSFLSLASSRPAKPGSDVAADVLTLRGSLGVVSTLDLLQMICVAHQSWHVRLYGQGVDGDVVVVDGELISARWGGLLGPPGLTEIIACNWGCFDLVSPKRVPPRNLFGSSQSLLLRAVQTLDERHHQHELRSQSQPPPSRPPTSLTARSGELSLAELFPNRGRHDTLDEGWSAPSKWPSHSSIDATATAEGLIDQGFVALRSGNQAEARILWQKALALAPDNRSLQFNLRKLDSMPPPNSNK